MELDFKPEIEAELHKMAAADGVDPVAFLSLYIRREAERRAWIENSKPKERRPVGRPSLSPTEKQARELGANLRKIYDKRAQFLGDGSLSEAREALEAAIANYDLEKLQELQATKAWLGERT